MKFTPRKCEVCARHYDEECVQISPNPRRWCSWDCAHESADYASPFEVLYLRDGCLDRIRTTGKGKPEELR